MKNNVASFYHKVAEEANRNELNTIINDIEEKIKVEASNGAFHYSYRAWKKENARDLKKYFKKLGFKCKISHHIGNYCEVYFLVFKW